MVAAINICICDRDGRRPSSTPAHFEAPDALGSGERGGRILTPAEFQVRALADILGRCLQHRGGEPEQAKGADGMQLFALDCRAHIVDAEMD